MRVTRTWRDLLALGALPAVFVPLVALLHNWPWVRFDPESNLPTDPAWTALAIAAPFEACAGASLVMCALAVMAKRRGKGIRRTLWRTWQSSLRDGTATALIAMIVIFGLGVAASVGGPPAEVLLTLPAEEVLKEVNMTPGLPPAWLWSALNGLGLLITLASLGMFYLVGLPCLATVKLMGAESVGDFSLGAWMGLSALIGVFGVGLVWDRHLGSIGLGCEGPGAFVLFAGTYFALGAGYGALRAYRRLTG